LVILDDMPPTEDDAALYPIDEVARMLRLRPSAIRYYEQRGLVAATTRRGGKRCFDAGQVRRLRMIQLWQQEGMLGLDGIAKFLDDPTDAKSWARTVDEQIGALTTRIDQLHAARDYLLHVRHHHDTTTPDGCPHFEEQLSLNAATPPNHHLRPIQTGVLP
jgi:MerR family transcriptional regulator, copper efflux regulator